MNAERKKPSSQLGTEPEVPSRTDRAPRSLSGGTAPGWTGLSWKSLLGLEEAPPRSRSAEGPTSSRPSETRRASKQRLSPTAGFYSTKPDAQDAVLTISPPVVIPKAPQLPADLVGTSGPASTAVTTSRLVSATSPIEVDGPPPPSVAFAHFPPPLEPAVPYENAEVNGSARGEPNVHDAAPMPDASSTPAAPQGRSTLQFPTHIREQAEGWLKSGSLSLPHCSSPRHARAMQRALLLALLDRPGYHSLPLGLQQRVGWLLSPGWERQTTGSVASEASDLLTVLCVASGPGSMQTLMSALRQLIPDPLPLVRPPSSYPPARR